MGTAIPRWLMALTLIAGLLAEVGLGQERPNPSAGLAPSSGQKAAPLGVSSPQRPLSLLERQMELSARAGADWLCRANRPDGRFVYGYVPALKMVLEGDHYLRQAGAAVAL